MLESVYEICLFTELTNRGYKVSRQQSISLNYKGVILDTELRLDLLVEDCIVVELKATDKLHPVHEAQLLSYMKLLENPKEF
ncbi:MAG: GxxExxY protein [Bacteroidota bacterium]